VNVNKLRAYGSPPFKVAVVHGGPGAAGEMAPVAREMASRWGVLEPFQTKASLEGQVQELKTTLEDNADLPVTLIGFSWGAWLSYLVAARYPALITKVVLVGSGPFEEKYAYAILETRLNRLGEDDTSEVRSLLETLGNPATADRTRSFARLGTLLSKADSYDALESDSESTDYDVGLFQAVWPEAAELRRSGQLLGLGRRIRCPVAAIHGDYDAHPAEGVREPLSRVLQNFRFVLLRDCGHKPWMERQARDDFYRILREEMVS
jgi:pimeloyl-ACP methyl ester carboxylesterase